MTCLPAVLTITSCFWLVRSIAILSLAWRQKFISTKNNSQSTALTTTHCPAVSILIPAFNEERAIQRCLLSCLDSDYNNKEIILVDDGSTDKTSKRAETILHTNPNARIKIIRLPTNQGKTTALNLGLQQAKGELIVILDADTIFGDNSSLLALIKPLIDHQSLSGSTANLHLLHTNESLGMVQSIEYTKFLNSSKRAQSLLGSIMILPGAMSAFRCSALHSIGGFSTRTLAEDADATMQLLVQGHRLIFQADCIGITEGPHTIGDLLRQRLRWRIGQIQCLLKHPQLLTITPVKSVFYVDLAVMNLISAVTPIIIILFWRFDLSTELRLLTWLGLGCIAADLCCTAVAFHLDDETIPSPIDYLRYFTFFTLFNPIITWSAITSLMLQKTTAWHHSSRY